MSQVNDEFWSNARQVRDQLASKLLDNPVVSLIDIGYDLRDDDEEAFSRIGVRVHVRDKSAIESLDLPSEVEGIPVFVVLADYKPE